MKKNIKVTLFCLFSLLLCEITHSQILRKPSMSTTAPQSTELVSNLNQALEGTENNPIYLITVTRQEAGEISDEDWTIVKNVLTDLCNDNPLPGPNIPNSMLGMTTNLDQLNEMKNKCKLVVFSEYFFKKITNSGTLTIIAPNIGNINDGLVPLRKEDDCENKYIPQLAGISTHCLKTIFYPNFLYFRSFNAPADDEIKRIYDAKPRMNSSSQNRLMCNPNNEIRFVVANITISIFDGRLITEYKKSSYFREADDFIEINKIKPFFRPIEINRYAGIYDFGDGSDKISSSFAQPNIQRGSNIDVTTLRDVLLKNISTEICFDLAQKVRNSNGWSNTDDSQAQLHILQSNSIDPIGRTYENENLNNLPRNRLILHSDAAFDTDAYAGSRLFKINETGAPVLFPKLFELVLVNGKIKITVYKVLN